MSKQMTKSMIESLEQQCKEEILESITRFSNLSGIHLSRISISLKKEPNQYGNVKNLDIRY